MSVARVTEISAGSKESFEDALKKGVARAAKTLRNIKSAWVKEHCVKIEGDTDLPDFLYQQDRETTAWVGSNPVGVLGG